MENEELPAGKSAVPINRATIEGCEVSKDLASSVLTKKIMKQLGDRIEYNGAGSFIICDGKNDLPKNLGMSRIIVNNIDEKRRPAEASAWLTEECLQKSPSSAAYAPPGYLAQYTLKNGVNLYTRGHLDCRNIRQRERHVERQNEQSAEHRHPDPVGQSVIN